jgi:hypothetical protein
MKVLAAVIALLTVPAPAFAGTLEYRPSDFTPSSLYTAAPGEINDVTSSREGTSVIVRDAGAPVLPGSGCTAIDEHAARCPASDVELRLGDGDDRSIGLSPGRITASGGAGNDILIGGPGQDSLDGDAGADTISGRGEGDFIAGGDGYDTLDGGDGSDTASYFDDAPVNIDLAAVTGNPDALRGIENLVGSRGDDVLRGDAAANKLDGGDGDDVLEGRDGSDILGGGTGFDRLHGGPGNDELATDSDSVDPGAIERAGEPAVCGSGNDLVAEQSHDVLDGCERLELPLGYFAPVFDPRPVLHGHTATLRLRCTQDLRRGACRTKVTIAQRGRRLGSRTVRFTGRAHPVRVPLTRRPRGTLHITLHYLGRIPAEPRQARTAYAIRLGSAPT